MVSNVILRLVPGLLIKSVLTTTLLVNVHRVLSIRLLFTIVLRKIPYLSILFLFYTILLLLHLIFQVILHKTELLKIILIIVFFSYVDKVGRLKFTALDVAIFHFLELLPWYFATYILFFKLKLHIFLEITRLNYFL